MIAMDAHVHIYPEFDTTDFMRYAHKNLTAHRSSDGESPTAGMLCLTETSACNYFACLGDLALDAWEMSATGEPFTVKLTKADHMPILVVAGHQVQTEERLEVLVLGSLDKPQDGVPARELLADLLAQPGPIAVIPWSFGRWFGARGAIIRQLVEEFGSGLALGDSGVRPALFGQPELIRYSKTFGLMTLSGSDPLPIPGEERSVAKLVNLLEVDLNCDAPFEDAKRWIRDAVNIQESGCYERLLRFGSHQVKMQLRK